MPRRCAPGGIVVVTDWAHRHSLTDVFAYLACRYVAADVNVRFMPAAELRHLVRSNLRGFRQVAEPRIPSKRNNLLLAM